MKQKPINTSEDEYYKMRAWQNDKLIQAVSMEANHFVKAFRQCLNGDASNPQDVNREIEQLQTIFKEGKSWTKEKLESEIFKLKALTNSLTADNKNGFHLAMKQLLNQGIDHAYFTPENLTRVVSSYKRTGSKSKPISHPPILFLSFLLYGDWLKSVKANTQNIGSSINTNYEKLFNDSFDEAVIESDTYIKNFNQRLSALNTSEEYKNLILEELNRLHGMYKESDCGKYIILLFNEEALKTLFISNCIFEGNPKIQSKILKQTIIANVESEFLFRQLEEKYLDPVLSKSLKSIFTLKLIIIDIINSMVPDSTTIQRMLIASSKMIGELSKRQKPSIFILKDLQKELLELFDVTERRLDEHMSNLNDATVYEYTKTALRELKTKCRETKELKTDTSEKISQLQKLLSDEFALIKSVSKPVDIEKLLKQKPIEKKEVQFWVQKIFYPTS